MIPNFKILAVLEVSGLASETLVVIVPGDETAGDQLIIKPSKLGFELGNGNFSLYLTDHNANIFASFLIDNNIIVQTGLYKS